MKLSFEQLKKIATGVARVERDGDGIRFFRFTEAQESLYKRTNADFYAKSFATAGVRLSFLTDSKTLVLRGEATDGSSRLYYSVDVFVNGSPHGYIDNFSHVDMPADYAHIQLPIGKFGGEMSLGEGEKEVEIYLPWSVSMRLDELSLDDGAYVSPIKRKKTFLVFGDSITQGYDALRPSNRYMSRLCNALGAEEINKAIGGELFFKELARERDDIEPDCIIVAYGSNNWSKGTREGMRDNSRGFFCALRENYPTTKIFALTPIWRKDLGEYRVFGDFCDVDPEIREAVKGLDVTVIDGFDFVPKEEKYFADLRLHPNDEGFEFYFNNLLSAIRDKI